MTIAAAWCAPFLRDAGDESAHEAVKAGEAEAESRAAEVEVVAEE